MFKKLTIIALMASINATVVAETATFEEKSTKTEEKSNISDYIAKGIVISVPVTLAGLSWILNPTFEINADFTKNNVKNDSLAGLAIFEVLGKGLIGAGLYGASRVCLAGAVITGSFAAYYCIPTKKIVAYIKNKTKSINEEEKKESIQA